MSARDAKNLKTSPLLEQVFSEFRKGLIERWIDATDCETRESTHAAVKAMDELAETLSDRIDRELGDEQTEI